LKISAGPTHYVTYYGPNDHLYVVMKRQEANLKTTTIKTARQSGLMRGYAVSAPSIEMAPKTVFVLYESKADTS
jgi:hypothetical protein